jgi:hypothetical protein
MAKLAPNMVRLADINGARFATGSLLSDGELNEYASLRVPTICAKLTATLRSVPDPDPTPHVTAVSDIQALAVHAVPPARAFAL